jgi:hypothetical protein
MRAAGAALIAADTIAGCATGGKLPMFGTWRVAAYQTPENKGPAPVQSLALVGISASFDSKHARMGAERCDKPQYTAQSLTAAEFQQQFKVTAASLGLSGEPVTVYRVECPSNPGTPARVLIVKAQDSLLTPGDGSFYELRRR